MSQSESSLYFIKESVAHTRRLPIAEARQYLSGMLELIDDQVAADEVRRVFVLLDEAARQMDFILEDTFPEGAK